MHTDNRIHYSKTISVYAISGLNYYLLKSFFKQRFHAAVFIPDLFYKRNLSVLKR
jgi:hypothetical protein